MKSSFGRNLVCLWNGEELLVNEYTCNLPLLGEPRAWALSVFHALH